MDRDAFGSFDILGNIALVKFSDKTKAADKKKFALALLKRQKSIKTVLEKVGKFKGRLRKQETKWIAGEKNKEILYKENGCVFRFNIDDTYFSPRLSTERLEVAGKVKKGDEVLVMFAGVGPYPIVIAKNSKAARVFSNEINRKANKYAEKNIELNKLKDRVFLLPGDVKKLGEKLRSLRSQLADSEADSIKLLRGKTINAKNPGRDVGLDKEGVTCQGEPRFPIRFDVIVMPRPRLKDSFLKEAFTLSKKGARIFYYDFCKDDEVDLILDKIKSEAKKSKKKIKILNVKKAGEIAPYKFRVRVDFKIV